MNKRGISAVVATVLIVLITIAAVTIVWVVVIPIISENLENTEIVQLSIGRGERYTGYDSEAKVACVQIKRGVDEAQLKKVQVIFVYSDKSYKQIVKAPNKNSAIVKCFGIGDLGKPDKIKLAPVFSDGKIGAIVAESKIPSSKSITLPPLTEIIDIVGGTTPIGDYECVGEFDNSYCNDHDGVGTTTQCENAGCSVYEKWCNGRDVNRNGRVDTSDLIFVRNRLNSNLKCNYISEGTYTSSSGDGISYSYGNWCERADVNQDGNVDNRDLTLISYSTPPNTDCGTTNNYIDCYAICSGKTSEADCTRIGCTWQEKTATPQIHWIDQPSQAGLKSNLVLYYTFDDTNNPTKEYSNRYDIIKQGNPTSVNGNGKTGEALYFDGDDYLSISDDNALDLTEQFSFSLWLKNEQVYSANTAAGLINKYYVYGTPTGQRSYKVVLYHSNSKISPYFVYSTDSTSTPTTKFDKNSDYNLPLNLWYHLAFTFSSSGCKFYVDGSPLSVSCSITNSNVYNSVTPLTIAKDMDNHYFKGSLDEIMIFNKSLTANEVQEIYNNQKN